VFCVLCCVCVCVVVLQFGAVTLNKGKLLTPTSFVSSRTIRGAFSFEVFRDFEVISRRDGKYAKRYY
jgi:hypothetical protein